ncbi:MAG: hypothetical protein AB1486_10640 [Planctomycetota bacterium]
MSIKWMGCLVWVLAGGAATARAGLQLWEGFQETGSPHLGQSTLYVHLSESSQPATASPGLRRWVDGVTVTSFEWCYGGPDLIAPVVAVVGDRTWPFLVDPRPRRATLTVSHEMREAWDRNGSLGISCEAEGEIELRWRPQRLAIEAGGMEFSLMQRASALVPGSRGWVEVFLDDITTGQVWLGIRTAEGELLAAPRSVTEGDEVAFRIGDEDYRILVDRLQNLLIGQDYAELRVMRNEPARQAVQIERQPGQDEPQGGEDQVRPQAGCGGEARGTKPQEKGRAGATDAELAAARGRKDGDGSDLLERARAELAAAEQHVCRAESLLDDGEGADTRAALRAARNSQEEAGHELSWRPEHGLPIGGERVEFWVEQSAYDSVPGSRGWVQVFLGKITEGQVRLGIHEFEGGELAAPRSVTAGDEVAFGFGDQEYAIRVERLRYYFFSSHNRAELRVIRRGGGGGGVAKPDKSDGGDATNRDRSVASGQPKPVEVTLIGLIGTKIAEAAQQIRRAENLLNQGDVAEVRVALHDARRSQEEAQDGLRLIESLASRLRVYLSVMEDLSVIKARILRATQSFPDPSDLPDPWERAILGFADLVLPGSVRDTQNIEAEILELAAIGKRYASRTRMGKRLPCQQRNDLHPGGTMELLGSRPDIGRFEEGQDYWLAITPPIAFKFIPREVGAEGRTVIVFAMRAEKG